MSFNPFELTTHW